MDLIKEYEKQYKWRDWSTAYKLLPNLQGKSVLDLGCGIGQQSMDFARAGAKVFAIDNNPDLLKYAKGQLEYSSTAKIQLEEKEKEVSFENIFLINKNKKKQDNSSGKLDISFLLGDVNSLDSLNLNQVDMIWSSFSAAYFVDFKKLLQHWMLYLKPGGLLVLVEVDDLFGHAPMDERARQMIMRFYAESLSMNRYDFTMGRKMRGIVQELGLEIVLAQPLVDDELCFSGPAPSAILDAWKRRLNRMTSLQQFCAEEYDQWRRRFMASLLDEGHRSLTTVQMVCARLSDQTPQ